jgi:hypothetical protein
VAAAQLDVEAVPPRSQRIQVAEMKFEVWSLNFEI